jgi:hypothetical protein
MVELWPDSAITATAAIALNDCSDFLQTYRIRATFSYALMRAFTSLDAALPGILLQAKNQKQPDQRENHSDVSHAADEGYNSDGSIGQKAAELRCL